MKRYMRPLLLMILWDGVRRKIQAEHPRVIAVTGSIGKTSAKDAIAQVLAGSGFPVIKTEGNLGTDTGVPLSLLGFDELPKRFGWLPVLARALNPSIKTYEHRPYYVLEYSSDKPGDLAFLTNKIPPDIGVITKVAPVHLQAFSDMNALLKEELAVQDGLRPNGSLVANADDPLQKDVGGEAGTFWYSLEGLTIEPSESGLIVMVDGVEYQTTVIGRHQLYPVLAAIAVGKLEGMDSQVIRRQVLGYSVPSGRGRLLRGKDGMRIIDDTYNASPEAVTAALLMLQECAGSRSTVAVLGRMNELGEKSLELHLDVARAAVSVGRLVLIGEFAQPMRQAAQAAGMPEKRIITFETPDEALSHLSQIAEPNEIVLVKASQNGMYLERLVKELLADPKDVDQLVRQSLIWNRA